MEYGFDSEDSKPAVGGSGAGDPNAALVGSIVQQLSSRLEDKIEDMLYAALQTTFDRIFAGQLANALNKVHVSQGKFLDEVKELISTGIVSNDMLQGCRQGGSVGHTSSLAGSCRLVGGLLARDDLMSHASSLPGLGSSVGHTSSLPDRLLSLMPASSSARGADNIHAAGTPSKGRLKLHHVDKLLTQDILRKDRLFFREREFRQPPHDGMSSCSAEQSHQVHTVQENNDANGTDSGQESPEVDLCQSALPGSVPSYSTRASSRRSVRMDELREKAVTKLVQPPEIISIPSATDMQVETLLCHMWAFWGIIPWSQRRSAKWHRRIMILLAALSAALSFYSLGHDPVHLYNVAHALLSSFTVASLLLLRLVSDLIGPSSTLLVHHAGTHGFLKDWVADGLRCFKIVAGTWICVSSIGLSVYLAAGGVEVFSPIAMLYQVGLFLAIMHCLNQLLAFLDFMVDGYCEQCFEGLQCNHAVFLWNVIQSLLRHVAKTMDNCLVCLQISLMLALILLFTCIIEIMMQLPNKSLIQLVSETKEEQTFPSAILACLSTFVLIIGSMVIFIKAAAVTERCSRVPALVNSMVEEPEEQMNIERQYLVAYITSSDAGFYIKGVRLSAAMIVKMCYICGAIISTLVTTAISISRLS